MFLKFSNLLNLLLSKAIVLPMKKVLKDGVSRTLGADVQLYGKRFSPEDADRFLSEDIKRLPEHATVA